MIFPALPWIAFCNICKRSSLIFLIICCSCGLKCYKLGTFGGRLHSCKRPIVMFQSTAVMIYKLNYRFSYNSVICFLEERNSFNICVWYYLVIVLMLVFFVLMLVCKPPWRPVDGKAGLKYNVPVLTSAGCYL